MAGGLLCADNRTLWATPRVALSIQRLNRDWIIVGSGRQPHQWSSPTL